MLAYEKTFFADSTVLNMLIRTVYTTMFFFRLVISSAFLNTSLSGLGLLYSRFPTCKPLRVSTMTFLPFIRNKTINSIPILQILLPIFISFSDLDKKDLCGLSLILHGPKEWEPFIFLPLGFLTVRLENDMDLEP